MMERSTTCTKSRRARSRSATTVLNTIARLTTLSVPGVARMGNNGQLLQTSLGTNVKVVSGKVKADIYIVVPV